MVIKDVRARGLMAAVEFYGEDSENCAATKIF